MAIVGIYVRFLGCNDRFFGGGMDGILDVLIFWGWKF